MKNIFKLSGIIILMAFIMFTVSACGGSSKGSGSSAAGRSSNTAGSSGSSAGSGGNTAGSGGGGNLSEWEKYKSGITKGFPSESMVTSVNLDFTKFMASLTGPSTGYYGYNYLNSSRGILLSLHYMDLNEADADNLRIAIQTQIGKDLKYKAFMTDFHFAEATYNTDGSKKYYCLFSHYFKGFEASSKLTFPADAGYATLGFSVDN